mmetsp:Transcript_51432/g.85246  ORF Transcript_51432/g.85246 Transcript_51432/m.85246 type:complete len:115 (-) Transcript_51432:124-468(-)
MYSLLVATGSGLGYYSGIGTKKYGRQVLAYSLLGFGLFSYLTFKGYIDFGKVIGDVESTFDQDGDGDFDEKDMKLLQEKYGRHWKRIICIVSGFVLGFTVAIKVKRVNIEWEDF